jgi:hypothetical protein
MLEVSSGTPVELDLSLEPIDEVLPPLAVEECLSLMEGELDRWRLLRGNGRFWGEVCAVSNERGEAVQGGWSLFFLRPSLVE